MDEPTGCSSEREGGGLSGGRLVSGRSRFRSASYVVYAGALALFVIILFVRGGPIRPRPTPRRDLPTTAISTASCARGARNLVPNPPGYPLLMSPLVLALRPGSDHRGGVTTRRSHHPEDGRRHVLSVDPRALHCAPRPDHGKPYPIWYRSQALLAILGWIVLAVVRSCCCAPRDRVEVSPRRCSYSHSPRSRPRPTPSRRPSTPKTS